MNTVVWSAAPAAAPRPDLPSIGGYEVLALLRAGDAGPLYRVRDAALGRELMLEEFLPPALASRDATGQVQPALPAAAPVLERARRRFIDESRTLASHDHPRLARVLHLVEAGGTPCRVMPGYPGRPLSDLLLPADSGDAPRDEAAVRRLLTDLMGALQTWHGLAGAHGGVHASRVLWSGEGHALLLGPDAAAHTMLAADEAVPPAAAQALGIAADVQAAVALARSCLRAAGPAAGSSLLPLLDAALAQDPHGAPLTPARLLDRLGRVASATPPPASAPPAPTATPLPSPMPTLSAAAPPVEMATSAPKDRDEKADNAQVDPATAALIRSIVDSIPDREPAPPRAARKPGAGEVQFVDLDHAAREPLSYPPPWPPKRKAGRSGLLGGLAVLVLVALGAAAWWYLRGGGSLADTPRPAPRAPALRSEPAPPPVAAAPTAALPAERTAPAAASAPEAAASAPPPPAAAASVITLAPSDEPLAAITPPGTAAAPRSVRRAAPPAPATPTAAATPRLQCGARSGFSLYRCMQQQCGTARWQRHAQCVQLRQTDTVPE